MVLAESLLHGVEFAVFRYAFDGGDLGAVGLHREHRAAFYGIAIEMNDAGTALTGITTDVRTGQFQGLADELDQQHARLDVMADLLAVDIEYKFRHRRPFVRAEYNPGGQTCESLGLLRVAAWIRGCCASGNLFDWTNMELSDEIHLAAPRDVVFAALNDPDVLSRAVPGCQSLVKVSDTEFVATVVAKVGPIKAKCKGIVTISDLNPPESYTLSGEGKAGSAGFANGSARVNLAEADGGTLMTYQVTAEVGGKLAQLGGRLVEATLKKLAGEFFEAFEREATERPATGVSAPEVEADPRRGMMIPALVILAFAAIYTAFRWIF